MIPFARTALAACFLATAAIATPAFTDEEAEYGVLVDRPGVDTTYAWCTACHSEMIVAQQGMNRKHWEEMLVWMVEEQGMPELPEEDHAEILDYLSEHYGEDRPNFPGG